MILVLFDRITRGIGYRKEARCEICESQGQQAWLRLKQSSYWYHMNFIHGINSKNGRPFELPAAFRKNLARMQIKYIEVTHSMNSEFQGFCKICSLWITLDIHSEENLRFKGRVYRKISCERETFNVDFFNWFKHAQKCHNKKTIKRCEY